MRTLLILLFASAPALAQSSIETRLREALRTANAQLQALQDEQAQWQAKEAGYKKEIEQLKAQVETAQKSARGQAAAASVRKQYEEKLAAATASIGECRAQLEVAEGQARAKDEENVETAIRAGSLADRASSCEEKNVRMYRASREILDWLGKMGAGDALAAREPFLQLKRVEIENAAQEYGDKLLDARIRPAAAK
jgi:protein subunit release factor A